MFMDSSEGALFGLEINGLDEEYVLTLKVRIIVVTMISAMVIREMGWGWINSLEWGWTTSW